MNQSNPTYFFELSQFPHTELFVDCQYVWDALKNLPKFFKNYSNYKIHTEIPQGAYIVNRETISIGEGTIVEPGAYIRGPCVIGSNCTIRHGAYIRGSFVCGDNCVIGHDTEIKTAIFLNNVHASHFAYVGDSILGNHVNLGAGTKLANLRFDRKQIFIKVENTIIDTQLSKLGAVLGDNSQTGCNAVVLPGTCAGQDVEINAGVVVGGVIPSGHYAMTLEKAVIRKKQ